MAQQMAQHFISILEGLPGNMHRRISEISWLSDAEQQQLLYEWNNTVEFPREKCVHQLFEEQVARTPAARAVVFEEQEFTYAELNRRSNRLAHYLIALGVKPGDRVGLCVERGFELIVAIMAVLKAGGAYVPLDPEYPTERLGYMLEDSAPIVLLTEARVRGNLPEIDGSIYVLDLADAAAWNEHPNTNPKAEHIGLASHHLAYIIYTSGSTGKPKGVMVDHANLARLFSATDDWFHFNQTDVWTLFHSYAFDFSVWEIWGALVYGGALVVVPRNIVHSPKEFYELLCATGTTVLNQTPSAFWQLITAQAESRQKNQLRYVIFGGESLEVSSLKPWFEQNPQSRTQLVNMYGITETTVHVTYCPLQYAHAPRRGASPIGRRIPD